ncbi:hypothetical protein ACFW2X_08305 [Streptomyces antibioticus]|uniref:hypothetical protein n=1 Tax=Streptomyces antibioticus TaxID=1890 RepID=UPI0036A1ED5A
MKLYIITAIVLLASLFAASGIAALTRGWVLPWNRRHVHRPRLHGAGQLVTAFALCWQLVFGFLVDTSAIRQAGTLTGSALLLTGVLMLAADQFLPRPKGTPSPE